ncbi:MAG TPA: hypothetical protein VIW94_08005 [Acidimicrobiia bacterium]
MAPARIALAASARDWSDRLHRSVLDHGGGMVVARVMSEDQAIESDFDVLFIDDICSFLTPRLIFEMRRQGKAVVGVFSPEDGSDGKRRLLEVGISDVAESASAAEEFLYVARASINAAPESVSTGETSPTAGLTVGLLGPPGGVGVTEVSIGLASDIARHHRVALLDLNQRWPSIGQRLGLRMHPNLRTAVDFALHEPERVEEAMHVDRNTHVVTGLANPGAGELPPADLAGLVISVSREFSRTIVDLGSVDPRPSDLLLRRFDALLLVGIGDPVGVTRVVRALETLAENALRPEVGIVLNRVTGSPRQRQEIVEQMAVMAPGVPIALIGEDPRLARAVWDGEVLTRGIFFNQIRRLSALFDGHLQ